MIQLKAQINLILSNRAHLKLNNGMCIVWVHPSLGGAGET